jgi:hypothetical protein
MRRQEWESKFDDFEYRSVNSTLLSDGKWISTIWTGLDLQCGRGPPLIFEAMVFLSREDLGNPLWCVRYPTEKEAMVGHPRLLEKWNTPGQMKNPSVI